MAYGGDRRGQRRSSPSQEALAYRRQRRVQRQAATQRATRRAPRRRLALPRLVLLVAVVAAGVVLALRIRSCQRARLAADATQTDISTADLHASPYDWSCLAWADGRASYASGGATLSRTGIDVSEHQGWIDWAAVAEDGIDFAFVRVGYRSANTGALYADDYAEYNLSSVPEAGLGLGVYFYSQATTAQEAREEAEFVLERIGGLTLSYPVVFDHEPGNIEGERIAGMTGEQRTEVSEAFCERIAESGLTAMVYGNSSDLAGLDLERLAGYGFWYAEYASRPSTDLKLAVWQYTDKGSVAGVDGAVDLDLDLTGVWGGSAGEAGSGAGDGAGTDGGDAA